MKTSSSNLVTRSENARKSFKDTLKSIVPMDDDAAERVVGYYLKHHLVKLCSHTGQASVKHGALLSPEAVSAAVEKSKA